MEDNSLFKATYGEDIYSVSAPVTVIIGTSWDKLPAEHVQFLSKILLAVGQSLESVRIAYQDSFDISGWADKPTRTIAFIKPPKGVTSYEIVRSADGVVVFSDPLEILHTDDAAKRKLWGTLKALFQS